MVRVSNASAKKAVMYADAFVRLFRSAGDAVNDRELIVERILQSVPQELRDNLFNFVFRDDAIQISFEIPNSKISVTSTYWRNENMVAQNISTTIKKSRDYFPGGEYDIYTSASPRFSINRNPLGHAVVYREVRL